MSVEEAVTWLFVLGSREDRFDRAVAAGAGEVIIDLEDAVAPDAKAAARATVVSWLGGSAWVRVRVRVRVNGIHTTWHSSDVAAVAELPGLRGLVVPKAEDPSALVELRRRLPGGDGLVDLIESAIGVDRSRELATSGAVDRLAFGSVDLALDLGASWRALPPFVRPGSASVASCASVRTRLTQWRRGSGPRSPRSPRRPRSWIPQRSKPPATGTPATSPSTG